MKPMRLFLEVGLLAFGLFFSRWSAFVFGWAEVVVVVCFAYRFSVIG